MGMPRIRRSLALHAALAQRVTYIRTYTVHCIGPYPWVWLGSGSAQSSMQAEPDPYLASSPGPIPSFVNVARRKAGGVSTLQRATLIKLGIGPGDPGTKLTA